MYLRIDRLQIELPQPKEPDPNAAAAVQELLGGRFGEMSTLMNYTYQSFNFRGRDKLRPYYDLIANIATEELGHIELVAATINLMLTGATRPGAPETAPLSAGVNARNTHHFIATAQTALVGNSMGAHWSGDYVFSSGNLILDLLHNFFLENGARLQKIRVYEMTNNPVAREMIGYLLVRGGVHAIAYAKALESLTGVEVSKLLPIPKIENARFPEARKFEEMGVHRKLYRFSLEDYKDLATIWRGPAPGGDGELEVVDGPPAGGPVPDLPPVEEEFAPGLAPEEIVELARKLAAS
uniref:Manganese catalase family protein n=1 Tax=Thermorudis peleae TaxID=1382356 RepID=A0A831T957_9BACT